ncbi:MAG TPA: hypothetical protein VK395_19110 [Gemmataceae bacterium]|nr:hypothetical protein [Gemmataceae bacterium]
MPRPPINLHNMVRALLQHTSPLPEEADCPIRHFDRSANIGLSLIKYIDDHIDPNDIYQAGYDRHLGHLRRMALAELIESFERFLKELASLCVDFLAPYTLDDRFDEFVPRRSEQIAAFVTAGSIGRALCESDTWIKNESINRRFRALLKMPFGADWEFLFPNPVQPPEVERARAETLAILWQIRHNLAHNVGVITHSDSMKFRVLIKEGVAAERRLAPSIEDLRYVKRFLFETASHTNERVGTRLGEVLGKFHADDPGLFDAQLKAKEISQRFEWSISIHGHAGQL